MNRLSACLISLNEGHNLPRALASLSGIADEIVIVDSGSTDNTEEIARQCGATFLTRPFAGYAEQRNFAASQAKYEWIFVLAPDEEISSELQTALLNWKKRPPRSQVYEMARRTWYLGKWIRHSGWYPDWQRRLYRRDFAKFTGLVHEALRFDGTPGRLDGDLLHYTVRTFAEHKAKVERYTTLAAQQLLEDGTRKSLAALWLATPWSFFQNFVLRGGFVDGYRGFLISRMAARSVRLKYGKLGKLVKEQKNAARATSP
jgi:glycosyltransferase involved in cell wall biosynthesis